ncbi:MAG: thioredoxin domain-containing protein [Myxococcota bacterium]|nr:thioredoxin domain-containing protein [Myxococcota bacterium]
MTTKLSQSNQFELQISPKLLIGLVVSAALCGGLAIFQWMELIVAQRGGSLSCSINETFNCAAVWEAPFAKAIHAMTKVPVAGWGLIWSVGALWSALRLVSSALNRQTGEHQVLAVRLFAIAGIFSSLVLGGVSFAAGAICITCIATYWLVLIFSSCAYLIKSPIKPSQSALFVSEFPKVILAVGCAYLVCFYPGTKTPQKAALALEQVVTTSDKSSPTPAQMQAEESKKAKLPPQDEPSPPQSLEELISQFPPASKQALSDAITRIRAQKKPEGKTWPIRFYKGNENAGAKFVEFTDIKCGHCARLALEFKELEKIITPSKFHVEPRQFPLDYECNKAVSPGMSDGTGVRCMAAKALICLETKDEYWSVQLEMFKIGPSLTKEKIVELAAPHYKGSDALKSCIESEETKRKLEDDIKYAMQYDLHGTPLVLLNGKEVQPIGALLFALMLAEGNLDAPAFKSLPPPSPAAFRDPHEGHAH